MPRTPKISSFLIKLVIFKPADTNSHPLIYLKMPFSGYFIDVRITFKVCIESNRVQQTPGPLKNVEKSSKNCPKSRLIGKYTPMGFSRSLSYHRVLAFMASPEHVKYPTKLPQPVGTVENAI